MAQKSGEDLKNLGNDFFHKHKRNFDDEQQAIAYFNQAIDTQELPATGVADCYIRCAEIYRDREPKTGDNFDQALKLLVKAAEVPGMPSWYTPQRDVEKLAMCPEIYGFQGEKRNKDLAWDMHNQNLMIQNGGDLAITSGNWFSFMEEYTGTPDPEWINIGFDYLDNAIEAGWDDLWTSIMNCNYGRGFKYHSAKTAESFNNAITWFQKAIDMDVDANESNQPWSIIGRGSARAYFELAELLLNPTRFGFDASLKNAKEGENKYNQGKDHLKRYGTLGPYSILESMFIDVWKKKMQYARTDEDMKTIEDLCKFGKSIGQDRNAPLTLFEAVSRHTLRDKSDQNYTAIAQAYHDCLKFCPAEDSGKGWIAEQATKWGSQLVLDSGSEDFSPAVKDLEVTKKLKDYLDEISKKHEELGFSEKVKEIIDINTKLYGVQLQVLDPIMQTRLKESFDYILKKMREDRAAADKEVEKLNTVKLKLKDVQSNMQLFGYYDGFIFTLSQAYTTAQVVSSGQVVIDSSPNAIVSLGIKASSYVPFIGNMISDPLNQIAEFLKGAQMIREANNVCTIAANQSGFDEIFQDSILEVISLKKEEIMNYKEDPPNTKHWYNKLANFFSKLKVSIESTVYGLRFKTPAQRLGNQHATDLISQWIGNGKIYGEKPFLLPDESKSEVVRVLLLPPPEVKHEEPKTATISPEVQKIEHIGDGRSKCCSIF